MTKRYKPVAHKSMDYVGDLNDISAQIGACCPMVVKQLLLCGVAPDDIDMEKLTCDVVWKVTDFALNCNEYGSRTPKIVASTVRAIDRDPQRFLLWSETYDPLAKVMVLSATARLSPVNAFFVQEFLLGRGPGPAVGEIRRAVPLVLVDLQRKAQEMKSGRPALDFQTQLAIDLGIIFRAQGGTLRRNPRQLQKTPFRVFLELTIEVAQPFARNASFRLNATSMLEKAQDSLQPAAAICTIDVDAPFLRSLNK